MKLPTLYKLGDKGKIQEWDIKVEHYEDESEIIVTFGQQNGAKQDKVTYIKSGKNRGKANETSIQEQAESEAKSKWNKQLDKGYTENPNGVNTVILPMLAHKFVEHSHKVVYPCYVQPKLDGIRCLGFRDRLASRKNKPINSVPHILNTIASFLPENIILDGELFNPNLDLQTINSIARKDEPSKDSHLMEYHVYDLINLSNQKLSFESRYNLLRALIPNTGIVKLVDNYVCADENGVMAVHDSLVEAKYEGSIIRNMYGLYEIDKRSYNLLKLKDFQDAEFRIVGMRLDKNEECVFSCETEDSVGFDVKPEGDHATRQAYYNEDNLGKMLNVRFFNWTPDGKPFLPVGVYIRSDNQ